MERESLISNVPVSLYRTHRPQNFDEVVGQEHIVATLQRAVEQDKLVHAYLFSGSRGTGKTSVARILGRHILLRGVSDPVIRSNIQQSIEQGALVDLLEIDAASHTQVDHIRELIENMQFTPVAAAAKVTIIDEVHMLSKSSFNALLKTLEEPPEYAYFILATTELHKIPDTIQSRCQRHAFRQLTEEEISAHLLSVAKKEHMDIDADALSAVARSACGGMRDALALLDQLRSLPHISLDHVREHIGAQGEEYVAPMLDALKKRDPNAIVRIIRTIEERAIPFDRFLRLLLSALRENLHQNIKEGIDSPEFLPMFDTLLSTLQDMRISPMPGLLLESSLLSLCSSSVQQKSTTPVL